MKERTFPRGRTRSAALFTPSRRFGVLLLALFSMLFVPVFLPGRLEAVVGPILFTLVLLSALADTRQRVVVATALAIPGCGLLVASSLV